MARENRTKYAVLGLLGWMPMSGYDVKQIDGITAGYFWSASYGQIYPLLRLLEEEGLARVAPQSAERRRERRVYEITDAGRAELMRWLDSPSDPPKMRLETMLKIFHGFQAPPRLTVKQVERFRAQIQDSDDEREANLEKARPRWEGRFASAVPYWTLAARFGELVNQAMLQWCDEALPVLRKLADGEQAQ